MFLPSSFYGFELENIEVWKSIKSFVSRVKYRVSFTFDENYYQILLSSVLFFAFDQYKIL